MKQILASISINIFFCCNILAQSTDSLATTIDDNIFTKVEVEASFPGGLEAWVNFLQANLKTNIARKNKAPEGRYQVVARFVVAKDGSLTNFETETDHGYGMEKEVLRVLKKSPKWNPAIVNGKPVNAFRRQPITFEVESN